MYGMIFVGDDKCPLKKPSTKKQVGLLFSYVVARFNKKLPMIIVEVTY